MNLVGRMIGSPLGSIRSQRAAPDAAAGDPAAVVGPDALANLLTWRSIAAIFTKFLAVAIAAWAAAQGVKLLCSLSGVPADIPPKWPLSIFTVKIPGVDTPFFAWYVSAGIAGFFLCLVRRVPGRLAAGLSFALPVGLLLVVGTNLIHGPWYGLVNPNQEAGQYYAGATQVTSAGEFLRDFEATQFGLGCHCRTHPPGAVLFFYGLIKLVGNPAAISLVIAALAVGLSGIFLYRILRHELSRETCSYITFLFLLIPAIGIYYCATLDAIVASCFLGVVLFMRHPNAPASVLGTILCLFCASLLTFGACFLLPVMVGFEIARRRTALRSATVILGVSILYAIMYHASGFNYLGAFAAATAMMHPHGFLLFAEPATYIMTRLENVFEIIIFLGPLLLLLSVRGMRTTLRNKTYADLFVLTGLGLLTLLAMFSTGMFRTGETARICLFIYPYLMFPVAAYLQECGRREEDRRRLLTVVFAQTVAMQTFGGYFW